ncbi:hypothetical protein ACRAWF_43945 [Streptomyces sp. L7]
MRYAEADLRGVPAALVPLFAQCLAKEPEKRPYLAELTAQLHDGSLASSPNSCPDAVLAEIGRRAADVMADRAGAAARPGGRGGCHRGHDGVRSLAASAPHRQRCARGGRRRGWRLVVPGACHYPLHEGAAADAQPRSAVAVRRPGPRRAGLGPCVVRRTRPTGRSGCR